MLSRPQIMGRAVTVAARRLRRCGYDPLYVHPETALTVLMWPRPGPICAWASTCTDAEHVRWGCVWRAWQWTHRPKPRG